MDPPRIHVENLGKLYRIGERDNYRTLRDSIVNSFQNRRTQTNDQYIWAIRGVSFDVQEGEVVGFIGANGAGKSTLLRLLSRITEPTEGSFELRGHVGSLLDIGTGFHPELTGRENIFLSGAILGMKKREIERRFDEIVEFSELRKFVDTPLKHYSSGMFVRLGFAVAAHMECEILLVDEVLAAGDAAFQKKCLGKIDEVTGEGRTVVMVSHNLKAVAELCERCYWLSHGQIISEGDPQKIVVEYLGSAQPERISGLIESDMHDNPNGHFLFTHIAMLNSKNDHVTKLFFGEMLRIMLEFEVLRTVSGMRIAVAVEKRGEGTIVAVLHNPDESHPVELQPGKYSVRVESKLSLTPGAYSIHLEAKPFPGFWGHGLSWDLVRRAIDFSIEECNKNGKPILAGAGAVQPRSTWKLSRK